MTSVGANGVKASVGMDTKSCEATNGRANDPTLVNKKELSDLTTQLVSTDF